MSAPAAALLFTAALPVSAALAQPTGPGAGFRRPLAVAVAADGTAYVADRDLPGVWKVPPPGPGAGDAPAAPVVPKPVVLKAVPRRFGRPLNAPRCLAVALDGTLLVGDTATREVYRLDPAADDPAPAALLTAPGTTGPVGVPSALAVGPGGAIYVADLETQRIYEVPAAGAVEAGAEPKEIAVLPGVRGLAFGPGGELFAVTTDADPVRRLAPPAGGDDGPWGMTVAVAGRPFGFGQHVAAGPDGTLYVADNYEKCVWKIPPAGGGFGGPAKLAAGAPLAGPVGLAWDAADPPRLLVADPAAGKLFAVDPAAGAVTVAAE